MLASDIYKKMYDRFHFLYWENIKQSRDEISKELEKAVNNGDCCLNKIADELMRINYVEDYEEAEELAEELVCNEMICNCNDSLFM